MFHFKQFSLSDKNSAMKIGTDAVLLGAWTRLENAASVLDVGTGAGILALMLAQRCSGSIDALDIDKETIGQAEQNILLSPWSSRIRTIHKSIQEYVLISDRKYELIVCNPPFFEDSLKSPDPKRSQARHTDSLSPDELFEASSQLLTDDGCLSLIFPSAKEDEWLKKAHLKGLFLSRMTRLISREGKSESRILVEFGKKEVQAVTSSLTIRNSDNQYSSEYKKLTFDFYLGL